VTNYYRSDVVEAIVSHALPDWEWCAGDWAAYDFKYPGNGTGDIRLEVKQTSALQSWQSSLPSRAAWDLAARAGYFEGVKWTSSAGRNADIYILAAHRERDRVLADHRNPVQWHFYVFATHLLPEQKSIAESVVLKMKLASAVNFESLGTEVEKLRLEIVQRRCHEPRNPTDASMPS
jgi:hypothetical protein